MLLRSGGFRVWETNACSLVPLFVLRLRNTICLLQRLRRGHSVSCGANQSWLCLP